MAMGMSVSGVRAQGGTEPRFKRAFCFGMLPGNISVEERFALARRIGLEGIEIPPLGTEAERQAYLDAAHKAGIELHSVIYGGWGAPFSSPDPAKIDEGLKATEGALRTAKAVGADAVLLVPAVVNQEATEEQAYQRSQEHIRKLIPLCEELAVVLAIEPVWNNFLLNDPKRFAKYVDEFQSPWIRAYFDVGNVVKYGNPEEWIRTLGKLTVKIHLKDFKRATGQFVALREGDVNWPEVHRALMEVGYRGYMTAELGGGDEAYLRDVVARMDKIIAGE
jgi:L-ribulose-5-phosphate 3-epimerase